MVNLVLVLIAQTSCLSRCCDCTSLAFRNPFGNLGSGVSFLNQGYLTESLLYENNGFKASSA